MNIKSSKITIFISDLDCGGAQRVVLVLAEGFLERGCCVDLVLARGGGDLESEIPEGMRIICLCDAKTNKYLLPFMVLPRFIRYLKKTKPDAVLSSITGANLVAVLARRIASKNSVLVLRHENTGQNVSGRLRTWLIGKLYHNADSIITISDGAALDLKNILDLPPAKLHVIKNPINLEKIRIQAMEAPGHSWLGDCEIPVLIAVGRLYPQKDFETLIHAFARLSMEKKVRLIILGEGPERARLELLVKRLGVEAVVSMPGLVLNPYPLMKAASVFVLSSRWEGLPIALMEAMALGCRIVATDCHTGPRELLDDGQYGRLVPVGNEGALKDAILGMLEKPYDPQPIMSRAEMYSPKNIVARHLRLLKAECHGNGIESGN